jgi:deoxyhypusine synthase
LDFENGASLEDLAQSLIATGFQATNVGMAIEEINRMVCSRKPVYRESDRILTFIYANVQLNWRLSDRPIAETEPEELKDMEVRKQTKCTIFLSYTSNMISCGVRETIKFLVKNKLVCIPFEITIKICDTLASASCNFPRQSFPQKKKTHITSTNRLTR